MDETTNAAAPWLPGEEACARAYNLVVGGMTWAAACAQENVGYTKVQSLYRVRGLPSPRRTTPPPEGGWDAAYQRVYSRVINGEATRDACKAEGISVQSLRRFTFRQSLQTPARLMADTRQAIRAQHTKPRRRSK